MSEKSVKKVAGKWKLYFEDLDGFIYFSGGEFGNFVIYDRLRDEDISKFVIKLERKRRSGDKFKKLKKSLKSGI